jgi:hypothetical protein
MTILSVDLLFRMPDDLLLMIFRQWMGIKNDLTTIDSRKRWKPLVILDMVLSTCQYKILYRHILSKFNIEISEYTSTVSFIKWIRDTRCLYRYLYRR